VYFRILEALEAFFRAENRDANRKDKQRIAANPKVPAGSLQGDKRLPSFQWKYAKTGWAGEEHKKARHVWPFGRTSWMKGNQAQPGFLPAMGKTARQARKPGWYGSF
jgi:hypothetical protein